MSATMLRIYYDARAEFMPETVVKPNPALPTKAVLRMDSNDASGNPFGAPPSSTNAAPSRAEPPSYDAVLRGDAGGGGGANPFGAPPSASYGAVLRGDASSGGSPSKPYSRQQVQNTHAGAGGGGGELVEVLGEDAAVVPPPRRSARAVGAPVRVPPLDHPRKGTS